MEVLQEELRGFAKGLGVDLFGVADLGMTHDFVLRQGGEHIANFPRAISLGIRLLDAVVDELYRHEEPSAIYSYRGLYNSVNANLDQVALLIAKRVQEAGYQAYPTPFPPHRPSTRGGWKGRSPTNLQPTSRVWDGSGRTVSSSLLNTVPG